MGRVFVLKYKDYVMARRVADLVIRFQKRFSVEEVVAYPVVWNNHYGRVIVCAREYSEKKLKVNIDELTHVLKEHCVLSCSIESEFSTTPFSVWIGYI